MITINCPACGEELNIEEEHRDWTVRCPICRHEFQPASRAPRDDRRPKSRLLDGEPRRPRRRRSRSVEADEPNFLEARIRVAGPGRFLELIGWLSALASIGLAVLFIMYGAQEAKKPGQAGEDAGLLIVMGSCLGIIAVPYSVVMAIGGHKMRNLSSRKWAMTAAILGIFAIVLFGLFGVFHIAAGIWGLSALLDRNVETCFQENNRQRRQEHEEENENTEGDGRA